MPDEDTIRRDSAALALDRAHVAAREANGSELRRAMQEARELLQDSHPQSAAKLEQALNDLGTGALVELDSLLECVRRDLQAEG